MALRAGLFATAICVVAAACGDAERPASYDVLVLVPDTVRADHVSINGYPRETTPRIDALAREGVNFTAAVSVAPRTWQSFSSILTGLNPPRHGVRHTFDRPIPAGTPMLSTVLRRHGYAVAAFDGAPFLKGMTGGRGFDEFRPTAQSAGAGAAGGDRRVADEVVAWIQGRKDSPYLAFVRLIGGHWPYDRGDHAHVWDPCDDCAHDFNTGTLGVGLGGRHRGLVLTDADAYRKLIWRPDPDERTRRHRIAHYDAALREVDDVIGDLLDRLEAEGRLERTLVVVTSDHGESFGEHGYLQHGPRVDGSVMRVPLIVRLPDGHPDRREGVTIDEMVRVIDVFPTIVDALGFEPPADLDGTSLLPLLRGQPLDRDLRAYGESGRSFLGTDPERTIPGVPGKQRMLRDEGWKLVWTPAPDGGTRRLYDLSRDPGERVDVARDHPDRVAELGRVLDAVVRSERPRSPEQELSPEQLEQLKALGYAQ